MSKRLSKTDSVLLGLCYTNMAIMASAFAVDGMPLHPLFKQSVYSFTTVLMVAITFVIAGVAIFGLGLFIGHALLAMFKVDSKLEAVAND